MIRGRLILLVLVLAITSVACTKCSLFKKTVSSEEVAAAMAPVICEKYAGCREGEDFQKDQCLQDVLNGISAHLSETPDVKVERAALDGCLKVIKEATCELLSSPTPPDDCGFLK